METQTDSLTLRTYGTLYFPVKEISYRKKKKCAHIVHTNVALLLFINQKRKVLWDFFTELYCNINVWLTGEMHHCICCQRLVCAHSCQIYDTEWEIMTHCYSTNASLESSSVNAFFFLLPKCLQSWVIICFILDSKILWKYNPDFMTPCLLLISEHNFSANEAKQLVWVTLVKWKANLKHQKEKYL